MHSRPIPGINVVTPFEAASGLGEASRLLVRAIEHSGIPHVLIPAAGLGANAAPYDVNVVCLQPDRLDALAASIDPSFFVGRTTIGFWFWESTTLPDSYRPAVRLLDRLWVTSEHVRATLADWTDAPVHVVPLPISEPRVERISRSALGLPEEGPVFLSILDLISARRKNPYATIQAFRRAFEPGAGPTLVLKTMNGHERESHRLAELERAAEGRADIAIVDGYLSTAERDALIAACDCYVSLHRAEGLGLPMLEAMALGKPVIATGFSGNLDFMDDSTAYLVPFELVPVPEGEWGYWPTALWAEPSVEAAASHMRGVFDDPETARLAGARARRSVLDSFSLERAAATVRAELDAARSQSSRRAHARRRQAIVDATLALRRDVTRIPTSGDGPTARLRRLLVRALWPQLAALHRRDEAMLDGLSEVERSLVQIEARLAAIGDDGADCGR